MTAPLTVEALNDFLQCNEGHDKRSLNRGIRVQPRIFLSHGSISVQASKYHYCTPRNINGSYSHVEVGFPSRKIDCLLPYAEEVDTPCETVYGWVPIEIAVRAINELENEEQAKHMHNNPNDAIIGDMQKTYRYLGAIFSAVEDNRPVEDIALLAQSLHGAYLQRSENNGT